KFWRIEYLILLDALRQVTAVSRGFKLHDGRMRHIHGGIWRSAYLESQLGSSVISWDELFTEASHFIPNRQRQHDCRTRKIIYLSCVIPLRILRIPSITKIPWLAITPHYATCLLQPTIWINKLRANQANSVKTTD